MSSVVLTQNARPSANRTSGMKRQGQKNYGKIHRNVLPVETFPLPTLIPHNPLSILAIALSYLAQVLAPPSRPTYNGYFSSATSSIHITDEATKRALWEMGFFGRGSLSRSEPTWLEQHRRSSRTAEMNTNQRRDDRRKVKLERAKKEQQEIAEQLSKETAATPVNSAVDDVKSNEHDFNGIDNILAASPLDLSLDTVQRSTPRSVGETTSALSTPTTSNTSVETEQCSGTIHGFEEWKRAVDTNGLPTPPPTSTCSDISHTENSRPVKRLQRQKTVRFSPTIEAREFDLSSPVISPIKAPGICTKEIAVEEKQTDAEENKEHLQISLEEAFFLSYGLGVLNVFSDDSDAILPPSSLLSLFRRHSYSPPKSLSVAADPSDPFLLSYAAYHHYRSMGWVVRSGVKFGVDYLLYNRGPAFSHAEFSIVVLPSYADECWNGTAEQKGALREKSEKTWWWLHSVNRVQTQVMKQLIFCYVDVPPPSKKILKGVDIDIEQVLSAYKVRDVTVKRWTPNRTR